MSGPKGVPPRFGGRRWFSTSNSPAIRPTRSRAPSALVMRALLLACAGLLVLHDLRAQRSSNLRVHFVPMKADSLVLDTLSIVPGSLHLYADGLPVGTDAYALDPYKATIHWRMPPFADSLLVRALDYNDIYWEQDPSHPSDIIFGAVSPAEALKKDGR